MTAMLYEFLRAYEEAEELIASIADHIGGISEDLARLRGIVHIRTSGLRIALGKEPLLEEEGDHEQAMREISPAEPLAPPAEVEETTEASAEPPDEEVDILIGGGDDEPPIDISFGGGIRIDEEHI